MGLLIPGRNHLGEALFEDIDQVLVTANAGECCFHIGLFRAIHNIDVLLILLAFESGGCLAQSFCDLFCLGTVAGEFFFGLAAFGEGCGDGDVLFFLRHDPMVASGKPQIERAPTLPLLRAR